MSTELVHVKHHLPVIKWRKPTLLERILLGIKCIGFCDGDVPEQLEHCRAVCDSQMNKESNPLCLTKG